MLCGVWQATKRRHVLISDVLGMGCQAAAARCRGRPFVAGNTERRAFCLRGILWLCWLLVARRTGTCFGVVSYLPPYYDTTTPVRGATWDGVSSSQAQNSRNKGLNGRGLRPQSLPYLRRTRHVPCLLRLVRYFCFCGLVCFSKTRLSIRTGPTSYSCSPIPDTVSPSPPSF